MIRSKSIKRMVSASALHMTSKSSVSTTFTVHNMFLTRDKMTTTELRRPDNAVDRDRQTDTERERERDTHTERHRPVVD